MLICSCSICLSLSSALHFASWCWPNTTESLLHFSNISWRSATPSPQAEAEFTSPRRAEAQRVRDRCEANNGEKLPRGMPGTDWTPRELHHCPSDRNGYRSDWMLCAGAVHGRDIRAVRVTLWRECRVAHVRAFAWGKKHVVDFSAVITQ